MEAYVLDLEAQFQEAEEELERVRAAKDAEITSLQAQHGDGVPRAEYDAVWLHLIEADKGFRKRVLASQVQVPFGSIKPYQDYLKGKSSEL